MEQDVARRSVFEPPRWLRDLGRASWLLVGVVALVVGIVWLLGETATIGVPVLLGLVIATVASPLVAGLQRRRVPRGLGALLVLLAILAVAAVVLLLVLGGITSQSDEIAAYANASADRVEIWLTDLGIDQTGAEQAREQLKAIVVEVGPRLVKGFTAGLLGLTSIAFGIALTVFSLFFLLKDGPALRRWVDGHLGVSQPVAQTITGDAITSLRKYFIGVSLDVPLAGTIAVVTFVTAYVPYVGAFVAGAFAVTLALANGGTTTALIMLVVFLLANGLLQSIVQPIAFGATLRLNPLLVLVVTIGAGSLFGMIGLILAAPLVSAAIHIIHDIGDLKRVESADAEPLPVWRT
jgi:predicted PurR-regulated permease PerM